MASAIRGNKTAFGFMLHGYLVSIFFILFLGWPRTMEGNSESLIDNQTFSSSVTLSTLSFNHIPYLLMFKYWTLMATKVIFSYC